MSVPVKDRHESQIQYSYATWEAYHDISRFVLKLSPKLQSLFGQLLVESSQQIVTLTVEASEIYRKRLTEKNYTDYYNKVVEAYAKAQALDVHVTMAYRLASENITYAYKKQDEQTKVLEKVDKAMNKASDKIAEAIDLLEKEIDKAADTLKLKPWLNQE